MKLIYFQQFPYRNLPSDFAQKYNTAVDTPYELTQHADLVADFADAMDELMHAARAGFDGLAVTEHSQSSYDMVPNPDLIAAALAERTRVEGIETAIYPVGRSLGKSREPLRVAEEQAMLDCLSDGRLVCGFPVGLAYDASINNGVPPIEIRPRFDENLDLIKKAWTERHPFTWTGAYSRHRSVNIWPRPVQAPHPPIWITGIGNPATMESVLRNGYGFNYFAWFGAKQTGPRVFGRFREVADGLGITLNPFQIGFTQSIAVADTDEKAERLFGAHAEYFFRNSLGALPMNHLMLPGGIAKRGLEFLLRDPSDFGLYDRMRSITFGELVESGALICGSPATVRDRLLEVAQTHQIGNLLTMLQFGSMPSTLARENIDLFASSVMPALRSLWTDKHDHHWWPERLGGTPASHRLQINEEA